MPILRTIAPNSPAPKCFINAHVQQLRDVKVERSDGDNAWPDAGIEKVVFQPRQGCLCALDGRDYGHGLLSTRRSFEREGRLVAAVAALDEHAEVHVLAGSYGGTEVVLRIAHETPVSGPVDLLKSRVSVIAKGLREREPATLANRLRSTATLAPSAVSFLRPEEALFSVELNAFGLEIIASGYALERPLEQVNGLEVQSKMGGSALVEHCRAEPVRTTQFCKLAVAVVTADGLRRELPD